MPFPTDRELERELRDVLRTANMEELSLKRLRTQLEEKYQVDLSEKKQLMKKVVTQVLEEGQQEEGDEEADEDEAEEEDDEGDDEEEEDDEDEDEDAGKKRKHKSKPPEQPLLELSPELAELLGEEFMGRNDAVKAVWAYIKANRLQNPSVRSEILNDERMEKVFQCKTMGTVQIMGKLSPHLKKPPHANGTAAPSSKSPKKKVKSETMANGGRASGSKSKSPPSKGKKGAATGRNSKDDKEKPKRRPSTIMWRITEELAQVVGARESTVDNIRSKINQYIKDKGLQDPTNKKVIRCDETLERIMGCKEVTFFNMQAPIGRHRLEKIT